jgi:hypothetical protein
MLHPRPLRAGVEAEQVILGTAGPELLQAAILRLYADVAYFGHGY